VPTWRAALAEAAERLGDAGEARWIAERVAHGPVYGLLDDEAGAAKAAELQELVVRRAAGEPLQHVLAAWSFRTLEVAVDRRALIPRPETEAVTEHALAALDAVAARAVAARAASGARELGEVTLAVDLGTGSGVIAISLAVERPGVRVIAVDASPDALALAAENLAQQTHGVRVRVELRPGSWWSALPAELAGRLTVVVANPPYLAEAEWPGLDPIVRDFDPYEALVAGPTGLEAISEIVRGAPEWLIAGGALVVEIAPHQRQEVLDLVAACGAAYESASVERDLAGLDRVLVAWTPARGAP
jgi:release factor glutamine methyltransferase